jgi:hypothetical protein
LKPRKYYFVVVLSLCTPSDNKELQQFNVTAYASEKFLVSTQNVYGCESTQKTLLLLRERAEERDKEQK